MVLIAWNARWSQLPQQTHTIPSNMNKQRLDPIQMGVEHRNTNGALINLS